jgi:hypothetical protein
MRMARKPSAIARELLRNFPKGGKRRRKRNNRKRKGAKGAEKGNVAATNGGEPDAVEELAEGAEVQARDGDGATAAEGANIGAADGDAAAGSEKKPKPKRRRRKRRSNNGDRSKPEEGSEPEVDLTGAEGDTVAAGGDDE